MKNVRHFETPEPVLLQARPVSGKPMHLDAPKLDVARPEIERMDRASILDELAALGVHGVSDKCDVYLAERLRLTREYAARYDAALSAPPLAPRTAARSTASAAWRDPIPGSTERSSDGTSKEVK